MNIPDSPSPQCTDEKVTFSAELQAIKSNYPPSQWTEEKVTISDEIQEISPDCVPITPFYVGKYSITTGTAETAATVAIYKTDTTALTRAERMANFNAKALCSGGFAPSQIVPKVNEVLSHHDTVAVTYSDKEYKWECLYRNGRDGCKFIINVYWNYEAKTPASEYIIEASLLKDHGIFYSLYLELKVAFGKATPDDLAWLSSPPGFGQLTEDSTLTKEDCEMMRDNLERLIKEDTSGSNLHACKLLSTLPSQFIIDYGFIPILSKLAQESDVFDVKRLSLFILGKLSTDVLCTGAIDTGILPYLTNLLNETYHQHNETYHLRKEAANVVRIMSSK